MQEHDSLQVWRSVNSSSELREMAVENKEYVELLCKECRTLKP
jgi:hypothetical protein